MVFSRSRFLPSLLALIVALVPAVAEAQNATLQDLAKELLERLQNPTPLAEPGAAAAVAPASPSAELQDRTATVVPASVSSTDRALAQELLSATDRPQDREAARRRLADEFTRRMNRRLNQPNATELASLPPGSQVILPSVRPEDSIADGEELIMEVRVGNLRFVQSIFTIKQGNGVLVDLAEISAVAELALKVDADAGTAEGFILTEDNTFELDRDAGTYTIKGEVRRLEPGQVQDVDGRLLVHSTAFEDWFGIRLEVDFRTLSLNVQSDAALPVQQRLERRQRFGDQNRVKSQEASLPEDTRPYKPIDIPFADISAGATVVDRPGQDQVWRRNLLGDRAWRPCLCNFGILLWWR